MPQSNTALAASDESQPAGEDQGSSQAGKLVEEIEVNSQAVLGLDPVIANFQPYFGRNCMRSLSGDDAAAKIARK